MRENFELEKIFSMIDPIRFGLSEILVLVKMWYFKKKKTRDFFSSKHWVSMCGAAPKDDEQALNDVFEDVGKVSQPEYV